ncbi:embigin isoform X2 [Neopelma chrysocephalum]|uniref:embigin isoform X2 n=1 Tax=Neopelma chrysocephalum TaxID=114329 RepID=UPI000FCD42D2|nr:embigin isoform X2 [Neopelma chrysocephalum]
MPATFVGRCLGRLLLLLLCVSFSGGSPADPVTTTQDASQSQANSLTKVQVGLNESSGPDLTTQDFKQPSKEHQSNGSFLQFEILLPGPPGTLLERNISLANATTVELSCKLDPDSHLKSPQVTWKRGNETISHTSKTEDSWSIKLVIVDSSKMGSYSCILKGEEEISATFYLHVPKIEAREKPIITYERDTAVMVCKSDSTPMAWTWYMMSGSKPVIINESLWTDKYLISRLSANVTRLRILKLTKEDAGVYWCEAVFELGKSEGKMKLKVLSIMAPLKPFIAIVAEVIILVTTIILYELYSKRKGKCTGEKACDQTEQLKSGESSSASHRKI